MSLAPGARLGPYEVTALIGAGGMGEVYRATDTDLKRAVALKVLPEKLAGEPDRMARLQREAEVLASLNHPNVAAIYGLERGLGRTALVMELVEGSTLAERIADGPLPVDDAFAIAEQIAQALAAAHERGIIHRDLKPANVKVRPDGTVKVLDFGLAKAVNADESVAAGGSQLATVTSPAVTQAGVILGTAAYMSPEQAKGWPVDKRCDVWAFGVLLYEMLSGRRAFDGEDMMEVLGAVVRLQPDWTALPATVPPLVRSFLQGCLEKDPKRRIADMSTAAFVIAHHSPAASAPDPSVYVRRDQADIERTGAIASAQSGTRRFLAWSGVAGVSVVAFAAFVRAWSSLSGPAATPRVERFELASGALLTQVSRDVAISKDGTRIVYATNGEPRWHVRSLDRLEPTVLRELPGNSTDPTFSPDGQWLVFNDRDSDAIVKVSSGGGPPVALTPVVGAARGLSWGADGAIVYGATGAGGLLRVEDSGGESRELTKAPDGFSHVWPDVLPGGAGILFTVLPRDAAGGSGGVGDVAVLDSRTGTHRVVVHGASAARYSPTGHLIYGFQGTLRAVPFDINSLEVTGEAVPVLSGVVTKASGAANFDLADDGSLIFVEGSSIGSGLPRRLTWVSRDGREEPIAAPERQYQYPRLSPDGTRIALDVRSSNGDLWLWDLGRRILTRLTLDETPETFPVWTHDSRYLFFSSRRGGRAGLFRQAADGTGVAERLTDATDDQDPYAVTVDGTTVIMRARGPKSNDDLVVVSLLPRPQVRSLFATAYEERNADLSPDGRWLAYQSNESGVPEIYVRPFPDVERGRWQVSTEGGRAPVWARRGGELFYLASDNSVMAMKVEAGPSWRTGVPVRLFRGDYLLTAGVSGRTYDVAADGRFLMVKTLPGSETSGAPLVFVKNWAEELRGASRRN